MNQQKQLHFFKSGYAEDNPFIDYVLIGRENLVNAALISAREQWEGICVTWRWKLFCHGLYLGIPCYRGNWASNDHIIELTTIGNPCRDRLIK